MERTDFQLEEGDGMKGGTLVVLQSLVDALVS